MSPLQPTPFKPPKLLRNPHVQTIVASTGVRKLIVARKAQSLLALSKSELLEVNDGIRLQAEVSIRAENTKGIVIMIHGWEGCADSLYLLSAGATLFKRGYNVVRLNLRDHGPTHHLNRELFNSTRIQEVLEAVKLLLARYPHRKKFMLGFSTGRQFLPANCQPGATEYNPFGQDCGCVPGAQSTSHYGHPCKGLVCLSQLL